MNNALVWFHRSAVLAAAWWILNVVSPPATAIYDPVWKFVDQLMPGHGQRVASFLQMRVVPFLLLDFIAWPLAEDHLRAKWKAELDEENRLHAYDYWQASQNEGGRKS